MQALVIGGGVAGLSTAIRLRERGHQVRVWARELAPETTSSIAAAVWYPYKAYPEDRVLGWGAATYAELARLAGDPSTGVLDRPGIELFREPAAEPWWRDAVPDFRRPAPGELPAGFADAYLFSAPVIEMPVYLQYLTRRLASLGVQVELRALSALDEALAAAPLVVNCAGLGARELAPDPHMRPIRGQVIRVAQVGLERFVLDEHDPRGVSYIIPRASDIVLGGTAQEGREDTAPEPATAEAILERCVALEPRLSGATILAHRVGLRPGRPSVRLEAERRPGGVVIHNYGHGGAGVTLSWGCADEAARLAESAGA